MRSFCRPRGGCGALVALVFLSFAALGLAQYAYNDDLNYYDDYQLYTAGYHYDMYDESEDGPYYNQYTGDYDDVYGDYFFEDTEENEIDCRIGADSTPVFNGTKPCDLKLEGADKLLKNLAGGLDGTYAVWSCENGRPLYKRESSPVGQDRVLWYSAQYRDWDVTNGSIAQEDDILMFGGGGGREGRPQYVQNEWSLATEFIKDYVGADDYKPIDLTVVCADGSQTVMPAQQKFGKTPLLVDDEMETQYKKVYKRAMQTHDASAQINLGLVTLFVMIGLGIVFGLPYLVARNRRTRKERGSRQEPSALASIMELSRKLWAPANRCKDLSGDPTFTSFLGDPTFISCSPGAGSLVRSPSQSFTGLYFLPDNRQPSSPGQELGWRDPLDVASMQQGRPGGSGAHPARIQVSTNKKPLFFYVNLAKRFLQEHGEVQLSALGLAISSMVTVAEILKSGQWAVERKITTGLDTTDDAGRERPVQKAKMEIIMIKTPQFDALMDASTAQQQGGGSDSPEAPGGTPPDASPAPPSASQAGGSVEVQGAQCPPVR